MIRCEVLVFSLDDEECRLCECVLRISKLTIASCRDGRLVARELVRKWRMCLGESVGHCRLAKLGEGIRV